MAPTLANLIDGLERRTTWKHAVLAVGGIAVTNLAMAGYILPEIEARRPEALDDGFLVMIDLHPMGSVEEVYRIFDLYTPDILGLVRLLYALDFVLPLAFALLVLCLIGALLRRIDVGRGVRRAALLVPFVALPFDYAENALSLFLIAQYQDGHVFPGLARVASSMTALKFLALVCIGLATAALLLRTAATLVARRTARPRT